MNKMRMIESPLADILDEHGTSLASYVQSFIEKADAKNVPVIVLAMIPGTKETGEPTGKLAIAANTDVENIPDILSQVASLMRRQKPDHYTEVPHNTPPFQIN